MIETLSPAQITSAFIDAIENTGDARLVPHYSGRGMYGSECLGVSMPAASIMWFGFHLALAIQDLGDDETGRSEARRLQRALRVDAMSRDMILYFPGYTYAEG